MTDWKDGFLGGFIIGLTFTLVLISGSVYFNKSKHQDVIKTYCKYNKSDFIYLDKAYCKKGDKLIPIDWLNKEVKE